MKNLIKKITTFVVKMKIEQERRKAKRKLINMIGRHYFSSGASFTAVRYIAIADKLENAPDAFYLELQNEFGPLTDYLPDSYKYERYTKFLNDRLMPITWRKSSTSKTKKMIGYDFGLGSSHTHAHQQCGGGGGTSSVDSSCDNNNSPTSCTD